MEKLGFESYINLGCKLGSLPMNYMGLTLVSSSTAWNVYNMMIEKVERRLVG